MPSIWQEPFGMVVLEAMACGTPVVGFNQGGVSEIVKVGQSGWLADYMPEKKINKNGKKVDQGWDQLKLDQNFQENVSRLTDNVKKIKTIDRANCRNYLEQNFSLEKMCQEYEEVYQKLVE
jgi:glycosyltransferase involved in cell wall biosynthesis